MVVGNFLRCVIIQNRTYLKNFFLHSNKRVRMNLNLHGAPTLT